MRLVKIAVLSVLILLVFYIRLAPSDPERWHVMPDAVTDEDRRNGALRVRDVGGDGLQRLHEIILATARTKVLAGSVEENIVTYITRSRVIGFPDYTTVRQLESQIEIYGRQRFGHSDFGVNATRIDGWLRALEQGG